VVLLAIAVVVGLVLGRSRPRAGAHSVRPHVEQIPLLAFGALLNATSVLLEGSAATLCLALSLAVLIAVAMANRHITGIAVIGLGLLLNLVAVAVNAGMPVRAGALVEAGVIDADEVATVELSGPRHLESSSDALGVLGDVLPIPLANEVLSFGDLIIVVGAGDAVRELSRRGARRETAAEPATYAGRSSTRTARVDQVWGTAPRARPVSAAQYSANPEATTPASIDLDREAAAVRAYTELVASQSR
jgi:hypothetical protein